MKNKLRLYIERAHAELERVRSLLIDDAHWDGNLLDDVGETARRLADDALPLGFTAIHESALDLARHIEASRRARQSISVLRKLETWHALIQLRTSVEAARQPALPRDAVPDVARRSMVIADGAARTR
jgi:hypothetical protein